jgi:hypothetical protein
MRKQKEPGVKTLTAAEVLDRHRKLIEQMRDKTVIMYIDDVLGDVMSKAKQRGGPHQMRRELMSMTHPAESSAQFRGMLEKDLRDAKTFQVTAEMVDVVSAVHEKSTETVVSLHEAEMPAPAGFIWLDKPQMMPDVNGLTVGNRAISWGPQSIVYADNVTRPGIRVTTWFSTRDRDHFWHDKEEQDWAARHPNLDLLYSHSTVLPFGERVVTMKRNADSPSRHDFLAWLHTLWAFMDTDIVTTAKQQMPRAFARRAARELKSPDVNVVYLRRVSVVTDRGAEACHHDVDWSVRWVVQGHYRHIEDYDGLRHHAAPEYAEDAKVKKCAACGGRITWVHAYVKGPEGRPLKVTGETVSKLTR